MKVHYINATSLERAESLVENYGPDLWTDSPAYAFETRERGERTYRITVTVEEDEDA